jgi:hypothetical protein
MSLSMRLATPPLRGVPVVIRAEADGPPGRLYFGGAGPASAGACPPAARSSSFEQFFPDGAAIFPSGGLEADGVFGPVPPGDYRACGWLQERADDSQAERAESLDFAIPSARTRSGTAVVGEIYRGRRRTEVFVEVRPRQVRYPVGAGRLLIEWKRVDGFDRFHRAGRPINLARARRFDICVGGDEARDAVRSVVRHPAVGVRIRARYLGSADFRRSRGEAFGGYRDPRDLRGYDRERDRCLRGGPVPSPPREN